MTNFTVWLLLPCEILDNICIAIIYKLGYDINNFEVKLIFLIKLLKSFVTKA